MLFVQYTMLSILQKGTCIFIITALSTFQQRKKVTASLSAWFLSLSADVKGICPGLHTETFAIITNHWKFM